MTDETTNSPAAPERPGFTIDTGDGNDGVSASRNPDGSFTSHAEAGLLSTGDEEADAALAAEDLAGTEGEGTEPVKEGETTEEEKAAEATPVDIGLPDYDPANEEVSKQYAEKYTTEDGAAINFEAFNASFLANLEQGVTDIHPSERAFVKEKFKLSDAAIDQYLKGVKQTVTEMQEARDTAVYTAFGNGTADKEGFTGAMSWALGEGGYTEAQKARYNAALDAAEGGDTSLLEEQTELLRVRYEASGKKPAPATAKVETPKRRSSSPAVSATSGASGGSNGPTAFTSYAEFTQAQAIAAESGDRTAMREVEERLRASPKIWKGMQG